MYKEPGYYIETDETTKLKRIREVRSGRTGSKEVVGEQRECDNHGVGSNLRINDNRWTSRPGRRELTPSTSSSFSREISGDKVGKKINNSIGAKAKGKLPVKRNSTAGVTDTRNSSKIGSAAFTSNNASKNGKCRLCSVCMKQISPNSWEAHVNGKQHRDNLRTGGTDVSNFNYIGAVLSYIGAIKNKLGPRNRFFDVDKTTEPVSFKCNLCETNLFSEIYIDEHLDCKYHTMAVSKFYQARRRARRLQAYSNSVADGDERMKSPNARPSNDGGSWTTRNRRKGETVDISSGSSNDNGAGNNSLLAKYGRRTRVVDDGRVEATYTVWPDGQSADHDDGTAQRTELFREFRGELTCSICSGKIAFRAGALAAHLQTCPTAAQTGDGHEQKARQPMNVAALSSLKKYLASLVEARLERYVQEHQINVKRLTEFRGLFAFFTRRFWQSANSYRVARFVCEPCSLVVTDGSRLWVDHVCNRPDHEVSLFCYACVLCSTYFCASSEYIESHVSKCRAAYPFFPDALFKQSFLTNNARRMVPSPVSSEPLCDDDVVDGSSSEIVYCCAVCQLCTVDRAHFSSVDHKAKQIVFCDLFFCEICNVVFYCDRDTYDNHFFSFYHVRTEHRTEETVPCSTVITLNECVSSINSASLHADIFSRMSTERSSPFTHDFFDCLQTNVIYFCKPCNEIKRSRPDWDSHLREADLHCCPKSFEFAEHFCSSCCAVIFSTLHDYVGHCHSEGHRKLNDFILHNMNTFDRFGNDGADYFSKLYKESFDSAEDINRQRVNENDGDNRRNNDAGCASVTATAVAVENEDSNGAKIECKTANKRAKLCGTDKVCNIDNSETGNIFQKQLIIRGIPMKILKYKGKAIQILRRNGPIKRTYVNKFDPGALYVLADEEIYQRLQKNVLALQKDFGTSELKLFLIETTYLIPPKMKTVLPGKVVSAFSNLERLNSIISKQLSKAEYESSSSVSLKKVKDLQISLIQHAKRIFNQEFIKSYLFGSRVTGLASSQSDIDIFLDIGRSFRGITGRSSSAYQKELVETFASIMYENSEEFGRIDPKTNNSVPIVKFYHKPSKLPCDLSFKSGMTVMNNMLVRLYLSLDVRVKPIVIAVKLWANCNELSHPLLFPTHVTVWMVLFFLMNLELPVVPSVAALREYLPVHMKHIKIDEWTCSFPKSCNVKWKSKNKLTTQQLLQLFFVFYSDPDLNNYVLSTLSGSKIDKWYFSCGYKQLPSEFDDYKKNLKTGQNFLMEIKIPTSNLCIQDPFNLSRNLTKNISPKKFQKLNNLCRKTADIIVQL